MPDLLYDEDGEVKVIRNGTKIYLDDGGEYLPSQLAGNPRKVRRGREQKEVDKFFRITLPAMTDEELIKLAEEV